MYNIERIARTGYSSFRIKQPVMQRGHAAVTAAVRHARVSQTHTVDTAASIR
jgi:hypothetical protein